jgi:hypothetical protein
LSTDRHIQIANSEIDSLDSALAWVVQQVDREFANAEMVKISIEQIARLDALGETDWRNVWTAAVSGLVKSTEAESTERAG